MASLATVSPRAIRCEIANFPRVLSLQKLPEIGSPITSFNFHGALKAPVRISLSEATELQRRQTQPARARSGIGSFSNMIRSVSRHVKAEKCEFIGDMTSPESPGPEEEEEEWSRDSVEIVGLRCLRISSSSSSPQQPIFSCWMSFGASVI